MTFDQAKDQIGVCSCLIVNPCRKCLKAVAVYQSGKPVVSGVDK